ncbi:hypothetical protein AGMMS50256_22040 [Betaproteobacteria bacterium]|nr:hypothetical protein AGMMS50256_22040 [Betaproteobacteria bacterium]
MGRAAQPQHMWPIPTSPFLYCPESRTTDTRFNIKLNQEDKEIFAQAAALTGTTMADFVCVAAKEKAQELLARESRITLSSEDFKAFVESLDAAFTPNPALKAAMGLVKQDVQRV